MVREVRLVAVTAAAIVCVAAPAPALAQNGGRTADEPFSGPMLEDEFPGGGGAQKTPEPTPTRTPRRTPTPSPTATPTPEPTPSPTATAAPANGKNDKNLPDTGSDPLRTGLMGLTLLGFGLSLRLSLVGGRRQWPPEGARVHRR